MWIDLLIYPFGRNKIVPLPHRRSLTGESPEHARQREVQNQGQAVCCGAASANGLRERSSLALLLRSWFSR
jgi:hypothetical protein